MFRLNTNPRSLSELSHPPPVTGLTAAACTQPMLLLTPAGQILTTPLQQPPLVWDLPARGSSFPPTASGGTSPMPCLPPASARSSPGRKQAACGPIGLAPASWHPAPPSCCWGGPGTALAPQPGLLGDRGGGMGPAAPRSTCWPLQGTFPSLTTARETHGASREGKAAVWHKYLPHLFPAWGGSALRARRVAGSRAGEVAGTGSFPHGAMACSGFMVPPCLFAPLPATACYRRCIGCSVRPVLGEGQGAG